MGNDDLYDFHTERLAEMPAEVRDRALAILREEFSPQDIADIRAANDKEGRAWWVGTHFSWGMGVRNLLRQKGVEDRELPSGNWDDYYVPLVEVVAGIRPDVGDVE